LQFAKVQLASFLVGKGGRQAAFFVLKLTGMGQLIYYLILHMKGHNCLKTRYFYGYNIVAAGFTIQAVCIGAMFAYGVFFKELQGPNSVGRGRPSRGPRPWHS
jgi:hypothetical protein